MLRPDRKEDAMGDRWCRPITSVVALLILTGCAGTPVQQSPEDQRITQDVRAALAADKTPGLNQVTATSSGGVIRLTGWASDAVAELARQIARSVPGVRGVVDQMIVRGTR
jgi:osmotically-inducible protein OsmY